MSKSSFSLIVSSDKRTWSFEYQGIFLSEWIKRNHSNASLEFEKWEVTGPLYTCQSERDEDFKKIENIEIELFQRLYGVLNEYHDTDYDERFWRILLGNWHERFVQLLFYRFRTLEKALNEYEIRYISTVRDENYLLTTKDSSSMQEALQDEKWNSILMTKILSYIKLTNVVLDFVDDFSPEHTKFSPQRRKEAICNKSTKFRHLIFKFLAFFSQDKDIFIINSYLPTSQEFLLSISFGQFPQRWTSPEIDLESNVNSTLRSNLADKICYGESNSIENVISNLLFELIPVCYLEGFKELSGLVSELNWPKHPRLVFTSNSFDTDEVFKRWVAEKVNLGAKYVIGQHGNNYGTHRYFNPSMDQKICDKFLTWGWTIYPEKDVPTFNYKVSGFSNKSWKIGSQLLLVEISYQPTNENWTGSSDYNSYFADQIEFVNKLNNEPRSRLIVRLHIPTVVPAGNEFVRWHDFDPSIQLNSSSPIHELFSTSRIVVFSYDSTGMLEMLALNKPFIAFWRNSFDHLLESAIPFYESLFEAGILHFDAESASNKVNEVWDDVEGWWYSDIVQESRNKFCQEYSRTSEKPIRQLRQILTDICKKHE